MDTLPPSLNLDSTSASDTRDRSDLPGLHLDNNKFYQRYDELADEIDENMVKGLKEHLDGLLIFAGLFAGVNSAFLALTLPLLSADPLDDTNALLLQNNALLLHLALGRNVTPPMNIVLPSSTFAASSNILAINTLFSISLAFALISSFLAVFGRQWLVYYRKRNGGGPDRERWEQLKRYIGAERWYLQPILDDILPSLLQVGLVIFSISLIIYLHTLHPTVSKIVGIPLYVSLILGFLGAICPLWDKSCPFQSSFSRFMLGCITTVRHALGYRQTKESEEERDWLHATAIRRSISTSDDDLTLLMAARSIFTIERRNLLKQLWDDEVFRTRILELCGRSRERFLLLNPDDQISRDSASAVARVFRAVLAHMMLSLDRGVEPGSSELLKLVQSDGNAVSLWLIPEADIRSTPAALVHGSLAFSLLRSHALGYHINSLLPFLSSYSNSLARAGWNSLALMVLAINLLVPDGQIPKGPVNFVELTRLKQVYSGDLWGASMTVKDIEKAVFALSEHRYAKRLNCDVVLVNIMHCVAELVFGQNHPLHLTIAEKVTLLLLMERRDTPSLRAAEARKSSLESFVLLGEFFRELRINRPTDGSFNIDDQETLHLFEEEVLKFLSRYGFFTGGPDFSFQQAFNDMFASYAKFKTDVYGFAPPSWDENVGGRLTETHASLNGYQTPTVPMPGFSSLSNPVPPPPNTAKPTPGPAVTKVHFLPIGHQPPTILMQEFSMPTISPGLNPNVDAGPNGAHAFQLATSNTQVGRRHASHR
ncbi:hypothetical protein FRC00_005352 [Tulasnella sp. 408]|nr:hypothetical protein FRC00_005352 [Tulasnella sp. 408]